MKTIGQKIADERMRKRWTQDALAATLGIRQSLLSDIENDKVSPKWEIVEQAAIALEVPVTVLIPHTSADRLHENITGQFPEDNHLIHHYHNDEEVHLLELLIKAKDETIESLLSEVKALHLLLDANNNTRQE